MVDDKLKNDIKTLMAQMDDGGIHTGLAKSVRQRIQQELDGPLPSQVKLHLTAIHNQIGFVLKYIKDNPEQFQAVK